MAQKGLRVLGLAIKKVKATGKAVAPEEETAWKEDRLVFLGLIGLIDPPKQGVKDSVEICQKAGVDVIMITGDHVETATAIATQLGIIRPNVPGQVRFEVAGDFSRKYHILILYFSCVESSYSWERT
jgi:Ca2+-transporting ATPase